MCIRDSSESSKLKNTVRSRSTFSSTLIASMPPYVIFHRTGKQPADLKRHNDFDEVVQKPTAFIVSAIVENLESHNTKSERGTPPYHDT